MAERVIIGRHAIDRSNRAKRTGEIIGAPVTHHADGAHGENGDKSLPDIIIKAMLANLVDEDRISFAQDFQLFAGDFAGTTDRQTGSGEGVPSDELSGRPSSRPGRGPRP